MVYPRGEKDSANLTKLWRWKVEGVVGVEQSGPAHPDSHSHLAAPASTWHLKPNTEGGHVIDLFFCS